MVNQLLITSSFFLFSFLPISIPALLAAMNDNYSHKFDAAGELHNSDLRTMRHRVVLSTTEQL